MGQEKKSKSRNESENESIFGSQLSSQLYHLALIDKFTLEQNINIRLSVMISDENCLLRVLLENFFTTLE